MKAERSERNRAEVKHTGRIKNLKKVLTNVKTFGKMPKAIDERDREESRKMILFFKAAGRSESSERQLRKIKNLEKSC